MNKQQIIFLVIFAVLSIGSFIYHFYWASQTYNDVEETKKIREEDFTLEYSYKENNIWKYTVVGNLPNPCYKVSTDALVAESYPEQVYIKVIIDKPEENTICTQVIEEYKYSSEFNASERAIVDFQVN